jgi:hypothetical protein
MDFGKILSRIKAVLSSPQTEWPVIAAEPDTVGGLFRNYICVVAALPVIAYFIRGSLIGHGGWGMHIHTPLGLGLLGLVLHYLLTLVVVYLVALIVNAFAPSFGGTKDSVQALKTVAYAWTAGWVAGIAIIIPWLGWLVAIAGVIYGIYLLYLGLPHTMRCPPERAGGYTAVIVIIGIVLSWIVGLIMTGIIGTAALTGASMAGLHATRGDGTTATVDADSTLGKTVAVSLSPETLRGFLPEELDGMKRSDFNAQRSGAMGMQISTAYANYSDGKDRSIKIELADTGNMRGMMAMAGAMAHSSEQESDHGYEKTYTDHDRLVHEAWNSQTKTGEYGVIVASRFSVKASGSGASMDDLKRAVSDMDLDKLSALKDEGVSNR